MQFWAFKIKSVFLFCWLHSFCFFSRIDFVLIIFLYDCFVAYCFFQFLCCFYVAFIWICLFYPVVLYLLVFTCCILILFYWNINCIFFYWFSCWAYSRILIPCSVAYVLFHWFCWVRHTIISPWLSIKTKNRYKDSHENKNTITGTAREIVRDESERFSSVPGCQIRKTYIFRLGTINIGTNIIVCFRYLIICR